MVKGENQVHKFSPDLHTHALAHLCPYTYIYKQINKSINLKPPSLISLLVIFDNILSFHKTHDKEGIMKIQNALNFD